jgi:hypothetical protein
MTAGSKRSGEDGRDEMAKTLTIKARITERTRLAKTYAEDGALHSSVRVLRDLALEIELHAQAIDREMSQAMPA